MLLTVLFLATWSQAGLFDRPSRGDWFEGPDVGVALTALTLFVLVGVVSHRVSGTTFDRVMHIGYRLQAVRFLRTAGSMAETASVLETAWRRAMPSAIWFQPIWPPAMSAIFSAIARQVSLERSKSSRACSTPLVSRL